MINDSIDTYYKDINGDQGLVVEYHPNIEFKSYESEDIRKALNIIIRRIIKKN